MIIDVINPFLSCRRQRALSYLKDDSSLHRPISHGAHRLLDLFQGKDAIDVWANLPLGQKLRQRVIQARSPLREFLCPGAGKDTNYGIVLQQREVHWHRRNLAAGEADRHQPSTQLHQPRHLLENRSADVVEADIDAFSTGYRLDPLAQVFAPIVDDIAGTITAHQTCLVVGADTGDDAQAQIAGEVDGGEANPARGPSDKHSFTGLRACPLDQGVIRRAVILQDRGRRFESDAGRQAPAHPFLGDHPFGIAARPALTRHAITRLKSRDLFANRDDDAGRFRAGHEWCRWSHLVKTRDNQIVHETHGGRMDVDQNLVAGRLRFFDLADAQVLGASKRVAYYCFHRDPPAWRRPKMRGSSMGTRWRYCW